MPARLTLTAPDGRSRSVDLEGARVTLGRSSANEFCYPDDAGLSRNHLAFELTELGWTVVDLASKNGTFVNGNRIAAPYCLSAGDRVTAGHIVIEFAADEAAAPQPQTVMFIDGNSEPAGATVVSNLKLALAGRGGEEGPQNEQHVNALVRAGRELAGHRPLQELFGVILDLALEGVNASRGVLLTVEGGELETRAARGEGFRISNAVRDQVLQEKASLLVRDAQLEEAFKNRMSIVQHQVRSMMAAPLEANDKVIGLIYVDTPRWMMPFSKQDLNLLTVMANVAAIRIEHERLVAVEHAERLLAKDLDQAAEIQRRLLPAAAPEIAGFDIAGYNAACRGVGGDYYDFFPYGDGCAGLLVADVSGKGMPAALMMSSLHARVQVLAEEPVDDTAAMTGRLNRAVKKNAPENRFVTFFFCVADAASGVVRYTNAGHNPPLVVHPDGAWDELPGGGLPLGLFGFAEYDQATANLAPGDVLVLYSDGVSEAPRPSDEEDFGTERLGKAVAACGAAPSAEIIRRVIDEVAQWTTGAPPADDITLVVARRL